MAYIRNTESPGQFISPITIGKMWDKGAIYIGRSSPLGNPFAMKNITQEERERVCDAYKTWFKGKVEANDPAIMDELRRIYTLTKNDAVTLGCFCTPKRCHGETIKAFLDEQLFFAQYSSK